MSDLDFVDEIKSKEEFLKFLKILRSEYLLNTEDWENRDLESYLEALEAYTKISANEIPSWSGFANILIAAASYD